MILIGCLAFAFVALRLAAVATTTDASEASPEDAEGDRKPAAERRRTHTLFRFAPPQGVGACGGFETRMIEHF